MATYQVELNRIQTFTVTGDSSSEAVSKAVAGGGDLTHDKLNSKAKITSAPTQKRIVPIPAQNESAA